jgi:orotidine-5'-phosphate decarboxylase
MSAIDNLQKIQQKNRSLICLGLDLDPRKMPSDHGGSVKGMFDFTHRIIDATSDLVCAYKPNLAFFESLGAEGLSLLKLIRERIPEEIPVIFDGKRGDIGNTSQFYAEALFDRFRADWVTVNPYMGYDSLKPFLDYTDKGVFVLCLTSNSGASDFQMLNVNGQPLYRYVAEKVQSWSKDGNCGLVVGATHPDQLRDLRSVAGDMPILIPGVGAQGGSLEEACVIGTDGFQKPAIVNVSRSVLYASSDKDFAARARQELEKLNAVVILKRNALNRAQQPAPAQPEPELESSAAESAPEQNQEQTPPDNNQSSPQQ